MLDSVEALRGVLRLIETAISEWLKTDSFDPDSYSVKRIYQLLEAARLIADAPQQAEQIEQVRRLDRLFGMLLRCVHLIKRSEDAISQREYHLALTYLEEAERNLDEFRELDDWWGHWGEISFFQDRIRRLRQDAEHAERTQRRIDEVEVAFREQNISAAVQILVQIDEHRLPPELMKQIRFLRQESFDRIATEAQLLAESGGSPKQIDELLSLASSISHLDSEKLAQQISAIREQGDVHFSAFYPRKVVLGKNVPYSLLVYAHLGGLKSLIVQDAHKFKEDLGGEVPSPIRANQTAQLAEGTEITIVPECGGIEFNPTTLTKKWYGGWSRFPFEFGVSRELVGSMLVGKILVMVGMVEIAQINLAIEILDMPMETVPSEVKAANPLAGESETHQETSRLYQKIFVSYSREDTPIVEAYRLAQIARGDDIFMDTYSIRTGENWRAALAKAIDEANILQLFWSGSSATSSNVKDEWDYALKHKCPQTRCTGFIRPVYWTKPLHDPPDELAHLNFRFVPLSGEPVQRQDVESES